MVDLHASGGAGWMGLLGSLVAATAVLGYVGLAVAGHRPWPDHRLVLWSAGCLAAALAVGGPIADAAAAGGDTGYLAHMITHLLLGMLAPLLLVLAAPITLLLRTLSVEPARRISRLLTSPPVRVLTEPVVAATLSVGGLWLLYTTDLYSAMHHLPALHLVVHLHLLLAGYLFTAAMISVDPLPHRRSLAHRSVVLIAALAAHGILAKHLYAHPPLGVAGPAAESGAQLMYYGGDVVDIMIMIALWARWYRLVGGHRVRLRARDHRRAGRRGRARDHLVVGRPRLAGGRTPGRPSGVPQPGAAGRDGVRPPADR